jgi:hypothetical protein
MMNTQLFFCGCKAGFDLFLSGKFFHVLCMFCLQKNMVTLKFASNFFGVELFQQIFQMYNFGSIFCVVCFLCLLLSVLWLVYCYIMWVSFVLSVKNWQGLRATLVIFVVRASAYSNEFYVVVALKIRSEWLFSVGFQYKIRGAQCVTIASVWV